MGPRLLSARLSHSAAQMVHDGGVAVPEDRHPAGLYLMGEPPDCEETPGRHWELWHQLGPGQEGWHVRPHHETDRLGLGHHIPGDPPHVAPLSHDAGHPLFAPQGPKGTSSRSSTKGATSH